jgi:hypothetical protein
MSNNPPNKTRQEQSLAPRSKETATLRADADLAPGSADAAPSKPRGWLKSQLTYWSLAWQEFQRTRGYRWMKASQVFLKIVFFTVLGLGLYQIASWLFPLLLPLAWLSIALGMVAVIQVFTIHFLGRFHERTVSELSKALPAKDERIYRLKTSVDLLGVSLRQKKVEAEWAKERYEREVSGLKSETQSLRAYLAELTKLKLVVILNNKSEVDMKQFEDDVAAEKDRYTVGINLLARFENHDATPKRILSVELALYRKTGRGNVKIIPRSEGFIFPIETDYEFGNMRDVISDKAELSAGEITKPYWLCCTVSIPARYGKRLNQKCFIRVTMEAMRQPPYVIDLYVDWEAARASKNGRAYIASQKVGSTPNS